MFNIQNSFKKVLERNWNKLYIAIDLHETVLKPTYDRNNISTEFYPNAEETLRNLSKLEGIVLIMFTSSSKGDIEKYLSFFEEKRIKFDYVNENPEIPSTDYSDFSSKFYFNILLDDKAGFNGETDWLPFNNEFLVKYFDNESNFNQKR